MTTEENPRKTRLSRRAFLGAFGAGAAAGIGLSAIGQEAISSDENARLAELRDGQVIEPQTIIDGDKSGFLSRDVRILYTLEDLEEIKDAIPNPRNVDINFDPSTEVAVISTLGPVDVMSNTLGEPSLRVKGGKVSAKDRVVRLDVVQRDPVPQYNYGHEPKVDRQVTPFSLVKIPRTSIGGVENRIQLGKPTSVPAITHRGRF